MAASAYVGSSRPVASNQAFQADRPIIGVSNLDPSIVVSSEWTTSANPGGTNCDEAARPPTRLYDNRVNTISRPTVQATTAYNYHLQLAPGTDILHQFDWLWLGNHNIHTLVQAYAETINVDVYVFDWDPAGPGPKTNEERIGRFSISILDSAHPEPFVAWNLRYDAEGGSVTHRFFNLEYVRIEVSKATNFSATGVPAFGEFAFGRAFQFAHYPRKPVDEDFEVGSSIEEHEFPDGEVHEVVNYTSRFRMPEAVWRVSTQNAYGHNENQEMKDWWDCSLHGARPTAFCLQPFSNQSAGTRYCRITNKKHSQPVEAGGKFARTFKLGLEEKPPFYKKVVR